MKNIQEAEVDRPWRAKGSQRMTFPQGTGSEEEAAERETEEQEFPQGKR